MLFVAENLKHTITFSCYAPSLGYSGDASVPGRQKDGMALSPPSLTVGAIAGYLVETISPGSCSMHVEYLVGEG